MPVCAGESLAGPLIAPRPAPDRPESGPSASRIWLFALGLARSVPILSFLGFTVALLVIAAVSISPLVLVFLAPGAIFVAVFAYFAILPHWTKTWVTITAGRLVLRKVVCGKEKVEEYNLRKTSRAKKRWVKGARGPGRHATGFEGIDVTSKRGTAHSGDSLRGCEGEMDWVEWRVNRFLGHAPAENPNEACR